MDYVGKTVRLKPDVVAKRKSRDENCPFKLGIVIDQEELGAQRSLLVIDDSIFGTWTAVNSHIEVVSLH